MPYEILDQGDCLMVRCVGVFTDDDLDSMFRKAGAIDRATSAVPYRVVDVTSAESIEISHSSMFEFARRWRGRSHAYPNKNAIIAVSGVEVGLARMLQTLIDSADVEVRIVQSLREARDWFEGRRPVIVPHSIQQAPPRRASRAG